MEERKGTKISLGMAICIFIIILLVIALGVVYYLGSMNDKNEEENIPSTTNEIGNNSNKINTNNDNKPNTNKINLESSEYVIKANPNLLGEQYGTEGYEFEEGDYAIIFSENNTVKFLLGWGIYMTGTYTISNENIITCNLTSFGSELPPEQKINEKISLKINDRNEIELIDIPELYTIKITDLADNGWELTDETKELSYWPLVKGITYILEE